MSEAVTSTSAGGEKEGKTSQWTKTNILLYLAQILSSWGDCMWQFGTGMFLVTINPTSLRLTAIYGFASGGSILFLGAIIGNWVDKNERLYVARTALIVQNVSVSLSALGVFFWMMYEDYVKTTWGGGLDTLLQVLIVFFAVCADVSSIGRTIAVQRDWIVVICKDNQALTDMSSFLRSIDLTINLLAPIVTGQVMTYGSMLIGAVFIAGWNLLSLPVEYGLLYAIYKSVPELALKSTGKEEATEKTPLLKSEDTSQSTDTSTESSESPHFCMMFFEDFVTIYRGWKAYVSQKIVFAGFGLAFLYMTVLGFDNITTGYAKQQGLSESLISILLAAGAFVGVMGTVLFPYMRKWIGLQRTGLVSFTLELACLSLCLVSVFVPGSPFEIGFLAEGKQNWPVCGGNATAVGPGVTEGPCHSPEDLVPDSYISIIFLMTGIVSSRLGLWMSDLTVTQLLLETPAEHERGIINGVQNSLNKLMDIIKFMLVIFLPWPQMFGWLVILSFTFIVIGYIFYAIYSRQIRGHLFDFENADRFVKEGAVGCIESGVPQ